jgi:vacuolar-type H+-ATPase subunit E/Vma4
VASFEGLSESRARASGLADGLIVEDESGTIRLRATSEEIRQELLSNKREELAKALFGGRIPE